MSECLGSWMLKIKTSNLCDKLSWWKVPKVYFTEMFPAFYVSLEVYNSIHKLLNYSSQCSGGSLSKFSVFHSSKTVLDEKVRVMFSTAWYFLPNIWFGICRNIFINPSQIFHIEKINRISQTSYDFFLSFFYWPIMLWYISSWSLKKAMYL